MQIESTHKLSEIQKKFNSKYPFLKLEFFSKPHDVGAGSPKKDILNNELSIADISTKEKSGTINIQPQSKAFEIEQNFMKLFGLSAQVFRLSGNVWLETTSTDDWTLEEQNNTGKEAAV